MSRAAQSVFLFSIYLLLLGLVLLVVPNWLLSLFGMPETEEVWVRVVGMLVLLLAFYYSSAARNELTSFMRATVVARFSVVVFFAAFVVLGFAPPVLIVFGLVDVLAATWTAVALRRDRR